MHVSPMLPVFRSTLRVSFFHLKSQVNFNVKFNSTTHLFLPPYLLLIPLEILTIYFIILWISFVISILELLTVVDPDIERRMRECSHVNP